MKKEIKNFGKIIEIILIILTVVSLIITSLEYTNMVYNATYDTNVLNALLISTPFTIILWSNNILIYLISIFYIIDTIRYQDNKLLRLSFCIFSILTTIVVQTFIINFIASLFGIF